MWDKGEADFPALYHVNKDMILAQEHQQFTFRVLMGFMKGN
jgi:hypothetical protein